MPGTTKTGKNVVVNVDSGEVRFHPPNDRERAQLRKDAVAVERAAKVAAAGKEALAENLCRHLGQTLPEVLAKNEKLAAAARSRQARGNLRREEELARRGLLPC